MPVSVYDVWKVREGSKGAWEAAEWMATAKREEMEHMVGKTKERLKV